MAFLGSLHQLFLVNVAFLEVIFFFNISVFWLIGLLWVNMAFCFSSSGLFLLLVLPFWGLCELFGGCTGAFFFCFVNLTCFWLIWIFQWWSCRKTPHSSLRVCPRSCGDCAGFVDKLRELE